jgi:hypothetical protein
MRKAIVLAVAALALPSVALATPPSTHTNHSKAAPKVMYILKGTFSNFHAATTATDGQISITVAHSNYHARKLVNTTLTFAVSPSTRITFGDGSTQVEGAKGMVKFRAPLRVSGDLATTLPTMAKAFHVIVQRAPTS